MTNVNINTDFRRLCCSECGVIYFFPEKWCATAQRKGKSWKCPNGHGQWYGESEYDELVRERDRLRQRAAEKDDEIERQRRLRKREERRVAAFKGQATKLRKRASAGVCPCCNRTFQNLQRHMAGQHPEFRGEAPEPELTVVNGGKS